MRHPPLRAGPAPGIDYATMQRSHYQPKVGADVCAAKIEKPGLYGSHSTLSCERSPLLEEPPDTEHASYRLQDVSVHSCCSYGFLFWVYECIIRTVAAVTPFPAVCLLRRLLSPPFLRGLPGDSQQLSRPLKLEILSQDFCTLRKYLRVLRPASRRLDGGMRSTSVI